ncbi:unnamed protein product [Moneuplotes crassus]|uniref:Uncharacterized protein n=1 Tax=Euplotes crassus TaxID=5936 RepID=A0AAD1U854_EUPCR|nr:unnamed protein product [Moneuplotes crassus]
MDPSDLKSSLRKSSRTLDEDINLKKEMTITQRVNNVTCQKFCHIGVSEIILVFNYFLHQNYLKESKLSVLVNTVKEQKMCIVLEEAVKTENKYARKLFSKPIKNLETLSIHTKDSRLLKKNISWMFRGFARIACTVTKRIEIKCIQLPSKRFILLLCSSIKCKSMFLENCKISLAKISRSETSIKGTSSLEYLHISYFPRKPAYVLNPLYVPHILSMISKCPCRKTLSKIFLELCNLVTEDVISLSKKFDYDDGIIKFLEY